jgi:hypothetical protein
MPEEEDRRYNAVGHNYMNSIITVPYINVLRWILKVDLRI